jgi:hypothetical protein
MTENNVQAYSAPESLPVDPMIAMIERVALSADVPVERLTALMDMRERQMNKEAEQVFNQAFAAAMAEMPSIPKSGKNTHNKVAYSTLADLVSTTRPVLSRHGLSMNWQSAISGGDITVTAIVRHAKGHSIQTTLSGPRDNGKQMNALQGGGSTETYLKRYTGFAILGLSSGDEVDDDGQTANAQTITADQYMALRSKADEAGVDEVKICLAAGVSDLHLFPASQFEAAMKRLDRNIAAKAGAA